MSQWQNTEHSGMFLSLETKHHIKPVCQCGTKLSTVVFLKRSLLPCQHAAVNPPIHVWTLWTFDEGLKRKTADLPTTSLNSVQSWVSLFLNKTQKFHLKSAYVSQSSLCSLLWSFFSSRLKWYKSELHLEICWFHSCKPESGSWFVITLTKSTFKDVQFHNI